MDPRLRLLADYFLQRSDASQVNPREINAAALPHLFILNIERNAAGKLDGLGIRFTGTALDGAFQRKLLTHRLEEFVHGPRAREVVASFHHCAESGQPVWMRQVVRLKGGLPRFVEGIAVRLAPQRIYGGLIIGEMAHDQDSGFESAPLS